MTINSLVPFVVWGMLLFSFISGIILYVKKRLKKHANQELTIESVKQAKEVIANTESSISRDSAVIDQQLREYERKDN